MSKQFTSYSFIIIHFILSYSLLLIYVSGGQNDNICSISLGSCVLHSGFTDELYITYLVYLKKKSQTTDFINVYSLLFKFSDFNQSKVSTEIFPDAVLAEILPVATSPRIPKSRNHESQDTAWEDLNFEPNGQSRRIGWRGGPFLTANIFFLNLHIQN